MCTVVMVCGTEEWVTGNNSCVAAGWLGWRGGVHV